MTKVSALMKYVVDFLKKYEHVIRKSVFLEVQFLKIFFSLPHEEEEVWLYGTVKLCLHAKF